MKIQFIESPTGAYNLAYDAGMVADFPEKRAKELIEAGYAVEIKPEKRINKSVTSEKRAQVQSNNTAGKRTRKSGRSKASPKS